MRSAPLYVAAAMFCTWLTAAASAEEPVDPRFVRLDQRAASTVLRDCADQMRGIFDGIRTWEGEILVSNDSMYLEDPPLPKGTTKEKPQSSLESTPNGETAPKVVKDVIEGKQRGTARFWYDRETASFRSESENTEATTFRNRTTQRSSTSENRQRVKVIVRPGDVYTLCPDEVAGDFVGFPRSAKTEQTFSRYVKRERADTMPRGQKSYRLIDPTITLETGGHRIDALVGRYAEQLLDPRLSGLLSVWRSSDRSTLLVRKSYLAGRPEFRVTLELTLDLNCGSLPQSMRVFREADGTVEETTEWEYEMAGEYLVPERYVHSTFGDGRMLTRKEFQFVENIVNSPIPSDQFEVAVFTLEEGDRIIDYVAHRIDRMQNGELVPVSSR